MAYGLLPSQLRSFYHFIYYTFINIRRKNTSLLFKQMLSFKKVGKSTRTRHLFNQPIHLTNFYKYSYLTYF
jgi:hypothetical protein